MISAKQVGSNTERVELNVCMWKGCCHKRKKTPNWLREEFTVTVMVEKRSEKRESSIKEREFAQCYPVNALQLLAFRQRAGIYL